MSTWISTSVSDGPLRRAQAVAGVTEDGLRIAQALLTDKLEGQIRSIEDGFTRLGVTAKSGASTRRVISDLRKSIAAISTDFELRQLLTREAFAARLYWELLYGSPLPWPEWTHKRVPHHWLMVSPRETGAVQQVRDATDPFNAILNYAYTLLEVETRIAIATNGLDPDLGLVHVDARARESLVYDLMDPVRSQVDVLCLEFCRHAGLRPHMFLELRDGVVRLDPDVCRDLAAYVMPRIQAPAAAAVIRFVALLRNVKVPYRLSIRDRSPRSASSKPTDFGLCGYCGIPLKRSGRRFCSRQCTVQRDTEIRKPIELAQAKLAQLAAEGRDPRSRLGENKERSAKIAESNRRRTKYVTLEQRREAAYAKLKRYRERKKVKALA